ncbi:acyl-CoA dehydrogenase family protein [Streptomyces sp. NPDC052069]|uniref:acyl-CoA dehydrogenase family protein n=1 Tax=Streptomyces sp. NPDC052069 TaxID=3154650 RepID=UPI00341A7B77
MPKTTHEAETGFRQEVLLHAATVAARGAREADSERRLNERTMAALDDAGFARHFVPRRWGGREGTFTDAFLATAQLAESCASAAWCAMLWAAHARFAGRLPEEAQQELWGESPDVRIAAAIMPPSGTVRPTADGWLIEGQWRMASGADHADWLLLSAAEADEAPHRTAVPPTSRFRVCVVPRSAVTVLDTWHGTGLRGTASNTVVLAETLVPDSRTVPLTALLGGDGPRGGARCHRVPAHLVGGPLFCAPALGSARRAVATWTERAVRLHSPGGVGPLIRPAAAERLARASADVDAVGLLLTEAVRRADTEEVSPHAVARNQRDAAVGADRLATAMDLLLRADGSHLRDTQSDFHRHWRDVLTIASHGALRLEPAAAAFAGSLPVPAGV